MLKKTKAHRTRAQSLGEYVILVSIVAAAAAAMFPLVKRGTQSLIKAGADQIGEQKTAEQDFNGASGFTDSMNAQSQTKSFSDVSETAGTRDIQTYDESVMATNTLTNMGFTKE